MSSFNPSCLIECLLACASAAFVLWRRDRGDSSSLHLPFLKEIICRETNHRYCRRGLFILSAEYLHWLVMQISAAAEFILTERF